LKLTENLQLLDFGLPHLSVQDGLFDWQKFYCKIRKFFSEHNAKNFAWKFPTAPEKS